MTTANFTARCPGCRYTHVIGVERTTLRLEAATFRCRCKAVFAIDRDDTPPWTYLGSAAPKPPQWIPTTAAEGDPVGVPSEGG